MRSALRLHRANETKRSSGTLHDGEVQELPAESDGAVPARLRVLESLHDATGVFEFGIRRREDLVDDANLRGVERAFASHSEAPCLDGVTSHSLGVMDVRPDSIESADMRCGRRVDYG
jgi:hypothetical protein